MQPTDHSADPERVYFAIGLANESEICKKGGMLRMLHSTVYLLRLQKLKKNT
jgi:hypothetical protein